MQCASSHSPSVQRLFTRHTLSSTNAHGSNSVIRLASPTSSIRNQYPRSLHPGHVITVSSCRFQSHRIHTDLTIRDHRRNHNHDCYRRRTRLRTRGSRRFRALAAPGGHAPGCQIADHPPTAPQWSGRHFPLHTTPAAVPKSYPSAPSTLCQLRCCTGQAAAELNQGLEGESHQCVAPCRTVCAPAVTAELPWQRVSDTPCLQNHMLPRA